MLLLQLVGQPTSKGRVHFYHQMKGLTASLVAIIKRNKKEEVQKNLRSSDLQQVQKSII